MIMADADERISLGLSALPSTKSTSIVDNATIDAIQEYLQTDAITFTAEEAGDSYTDHLAVWASELFKVRAKKNGFWIWLIRSMKCGFVDGLEAGMVRWRKEAYDYEDKHWIDKRTGQEIDEQIFAEMKKRYPVTVEGQFDPETGQAPPIEIQFEEHFEFTKEKKTRTVADTWECVQLKPGENLLWDFKNPTLDLNRGQWVIVILQMSKEDILNLVKQKVLNKITPEELKPYLKAGVTSHGNTDNTDDTSVGPDPDTIDAEDFNLAEMWLWFEKKDYQWRVTFILEGEKVMSKEWLVNDLFFGGRPFDRLPVVLGTFDFELWEAIGRGLPKLIASIEDEMTDHRNNVNDMAKQAATGKYRITPGYDDDEVNSVLNEKWFYAKSGDVEKLDFAGEMAVVMKAGDLTSGDIASLAPVSMSDPQLVGKGNAKDTLGSVQLAMGGNDKKLNAGTMIRNETFLEQILRIIVEMSMAFETSQKFGRIAAKKAKFDQPGPDGKTMMEQIQYIDNNQTFIDFTKLDFDVEIQINAGLGTVPRQQKAQKIMTYTEWAKAHPDIAMKLDIEEIDKQLKVLNGFNEDQFVLPEERWRQPEPPPVQDRLTLNVQWSELAMVSPEMAEALLRKAIAGGMSMTTNVKEDKKPAYLDDPQGSPSHPAMMEHKTVEAPQGDMG
jgi:hypothetical protein